MRLKLIKLENKTNGRFYYLLTQKDLFNELVLTVIRGGHGRSVVIRYGYNCKHRIEMEIIRLTKRRLRRGYCLIEN